MTELFDASKGVSLGSGKFLSPGSLKDSELAGLLMRYRRSVASAYSSVSPDEISSSFTAGPFHVSPKVDGELWFLILDDGDVCLTSPRGAVIFGDIPVLVEAGKAAKKVKGRVILAGELFAAAKSGDDRPRVGNVATALGGGAKAPVERLGLMTFDLVQISHETDDGDLDTPEGKSTAMESMLGDGKRLKPVTYKMAASASEVSELFTEWVGGGKAEGLIVRAPNGRVFKVKPEFTVDAVVVGYTEREEDVKQVRSVALAMMHEDGRYQFIGSCGNLGSDKDRKKLHSRLSKIQTEASFRKASSEGAIYRFVTPEVIVEVKANDAQSHDASDKATRQMTMEFNGDTWNPSGLMPGASLLHPVLVRLRDDKSVSTEEIRFSQILERCFVAKASTSDSGADLPVSKLLRREVYIKEAKGKTAVRKLLVWETNKEKVSDEHPGFVVHWTDYSPDRKDPIKRTVRLASSKKIATSIADKLIEDNVKKGWALVEPT